MEARPGPVFKSKADLTRDELADLFQTLADRTRAGRMSLSGGTGAVDVDLPDGCRVDIQVVDKPRTDHVERELEVEITWHVDETGRPTESQPRHSGFSIT